MLTVQDSLSGQAKLDIEKILNDAFAIVTPPQTTAERFTLLKSLQTPLEKDMPKEKLDKFMSTMEKMSSEDIEIIMQGLVRT